jgi:hypothetical protein
MTGRCNANARHVVMFRKAFDNDSEARLCLATKWPNAEDALAFFNDNAAKKDGLGPFRFASISDFNPDYHLVGRRLPNGPEVESFFLYCVLPR